MTVKLAYFLNKSISLKCVLLPVSSTLQLLITANFIVLFLFFSSLFCTTEFNILFDKAADTSVFIKININIINNIFLCFFMN